MFKMREGFLMNMYLERTDWSFANTIYNVSCHVSQSSYTN